MRTTSSFEIFPNDASERELAKARWLRREGRLDDAEHAYRNVMEGQPGLRESWMECFDLLRRSGRAEDALALAADAEQAFETEAFPIALKGAALIEQERLHEALEALETAVVRDPNLALTWHELGYAAYRIGDGTRALLALDRAFALEPHTETLTLRGRIIRETGELYAATVAFEAALHSATHDEQRAEIEHEVLVTKRLGDFAPRRLRDLTQAERWFAEHGTVVLAAEHPGTPPTSEELVQAFVSLARDRDWGFGQVVSTPDGTMAQTVAERLGVPLQTADALDPEQVPLLFAERPPLGDPHWQQAAKRVAEEQKGATFVVWHAIDVAPVADIVGGLEQNDARLSLGIDPASAIVMAQHPLARVATRELIPPLSTLQSE
ncbi:MAG: tetratricopeptide repeat protein [Gemmatimonadales bacterium]